MSNIINFDNFDQGTVVQVKCRDGRTRKVITKVYETDGPNYPHLITGDGSDRVRSVTNEGRIYRYVTSNDSWDVLEIINEVEVDTEANPSRPNPVARGYNRRDVEPKDIHGSKRWGQILWRDSDDNELELFDVGVDVPEVFDQWFPLNEIEFQVEEVTESLRAHREARAKWNESNDQGFCFIYTRGYLAAKDLPFVQSDYERAAKEASPAR